MPAEGLPAIVMKTKLRKKTKAALNDPELLKIRNEHFHRMDAVLNGRDDCERAFGMYGYGADAGVQPGDDPVEFAVRALEEAAHHIDKARDLEIFHPIFVSAGMYGVAFVDRILETELTRFPDWQARFLDTPVGELEYPDLERSETWRRATDVVNALIEMETSLPIISPPCLSSALNEAINLYGEQFLIALVAKPKAARRDLELINDVLKELHSWFLRNVPAEQLGGAALSVRTMPPGFGHIDGCSTHLISGDMYAEFVADLDEEILALHPKGGMIHLCGRHTQHIEAWRKMLSLKIVQLSYPAGEDLEIYFKELREDQSFYAGPAKDMSMERVIDATGGYRLIVAAEVEPPLPKKRPPGKGSIKR